MTFESLPLIESCDDCAACCRRTPIPPFQPGEESHWNVPDSLMQPIWERIHLDQHFDLLPCVWLDMGTLKCRHYDLRPQACRDFERSSDLCRLCRDDEGILLREIRSDA
jgi:Fe-S-cluster containining protein